MLSVEDTLTRLDHVAMLFEHEVSLIKATRTGRKLAAREPPVAIVLDILAGYRWIHAERTVAEHIGRFGSTKK